MKIGLIDVDGKTKITREQRRITHWCNIRQLFKTIDYAEYNNRRTI